MPKGKDLGLNRSASSKSLPNEQSSERMIANIAIANYRSCRASSTGSMRTQFLVATTIRPLTLVRVGTLTLRRP